MSIIHLSENDIQEYLDTKSNKAKVEAHILNCQECNLHLAEYESFYTELALDETPQLSVDFVSQTMDTVRQESIAIESNKGLYLYSIFSFIGALLFLTYFTDFKLNIFKFEFSNLSKMFADWSIFDAFARYYQTSTSLVNVLLFAGLILLFFALVDSILSRKEIRKISCFSI
jgi:hypothetical protein